jgi:hypothetical protein
LAAQVCVCVCRYLTSGGAEDQVLYPGGAHRTIGRQGNSPLGS